MPTPQQIKNQIIFNRWKRKWIKRLTPDEIIFPMVLGIIVLGLIGYLAILMGVK
jgi:hypothetical protein|tara:strand:+ start:448 stop:609 length:162 start_codon:yes stop_codon:yes gene_type:complete